MCQNAADDAGVNVPTAIIGNTDPAAARLKQFARRAGRELADRVNWAALTVENVFVANGTSTYTLPADFRSMVNDTLWDRSRFWRMRGAMSPQQWQMFKSSIIGRATIERRWRLRLANGDPAGAVVQFEIDPPITGDVTSTFVYEYVSKNWCASTVNKQAVSVTGNALIYGQSVYGTGVYNGSAGYLLGDRITLALGTFTSPAVVVVTGVFAGGVIASTEILTSGTYTDVPINPVGQQSTTGIGTGATFTVSWGNATQSDWMADTDIALLDEDVIELGIIWRLLRRLGLDYSEELDEYERRADLLVARDGGTATLDLAPYDRLTLVGPYNVPETGFGPQS